MNRRLRKILVRLLLVLVVLGGIGVAAFTWFAYWPLEGSWDYKVARLVPADVDFAYVASWQDLKETEWIQRHLFDHPLHPALDEALSGARKELGRLEEIEDQINGSIPLGITEFTFEGDVVPGDVVAAGRFCSEQGPSKGPPTWREILLLTRISWKTKFFSALKHGFVREQIQGVTVEDLGGGIYKFIVAEIVPSPPRERSGCGPGILRPPENEWYGFRIKDVLAISNSRELIEGVAEISDFPDGGRSVLDRPRVDLAPRDDTIVASIDMTALYSYLPRALEMAGPLKIMQRYVTVRSLGRLNGHLSIVAPDQLHGSATTVYNPGALAEGISEVYQLQPEDMRTGLANLVPAEDTFGVLMVRSTAYHLLDAIYQDVLGPGDRKLWRDNLRAMGRFESIDDFFREFGSNLGDTAGVAVGRLGELYDSVEFPDMYSRDPMSNPQPNMPAIAIMVRLRERSDPGELDDYLAERIPLLGGDPDLEQVDYRGLTYTKIRLQQQTADYATIQPAYIVAQNHFIFANNESYFRKIIDTIVDPQQTPSMAMDPGFKSTVERLPETAHFALYMDLEKLFRVPPVVAEGAQPRGFLWDRRNLWVLENRNPRNAIIDYEEQLVADITRRSQRALTAEERADVRRRVNDYASTYEDRYPEFLEEYRQWLEGFSRLGSLGVSFAARPRGPTLTSDLVLILEPPPGTER